MTEYEKLLKLEEAYPDYGEYQYLVCRRFVHSEVGDALSDYMRNGATVCKDDAPLTDTAWNRTYTVDEFNSSFKVIGVQHGDTKMVALFLHGKTWKDADGWNYSPSADGLFSNGHLGVVYEQNKTLSDSFVLVS